MKILRAFISAVLIWLTTAGLFSLLLEVFVFAEIEDTVFLPTLATFVVSLPVLTVLTLFFLLRMNKRNVKSGSEYLFILLLLISVLYGFFAGVTGLPFSVRWREINDVVQGTLVAAILFLCSLVSKELWKQVVGRALAGERTNLLTADLQPEIFSQSKNSIKMEHHSSGPLNAQPASNRIFFKGLIAGGLILLMLIPTIFVAELITEREARRKEVVKEVSAKWASEQTIAPPFLVVNYSEPSVNADGKAVIVTRPLILLPQSLDASGKVFPEKRSRSIYEILLYRADLNFKGTFQPEWPDDIDVSRVDFSSAKVCFGLNDFKGIEQEVVMMMNNEKMKLRPGKTVVDFHRNNLYSPLQITAEQLRAGIPFSMNLKMKGSETLHFLPLAANSSFKLESPWAAPSFDGNHLPASRTVLKSGFSAQWNFNQANLGFSTVMNSGSFDFTKEGFGVSMVQPADQYDKTERSVKYAILVIGLTFGLFFIMELTSSKPFHPVQYVLVGMALVIFYTLLLSISEFINFDYAYLLAASATIILVTWYAKGHFKSWRSAAIFATSLTMLYGFIFILLRLEDTALLAGSIGLFAILAIVMYASRRINWYGEPKGAL